VEYKWYDYLIFMGVGSSIFAAAFVALVYAMSFLFGNY
jgi:hypothetical protein